MPPQRNYSHIDTTLPISRVGYSPVYEDDDRYDEEEDYSSMTPLPVVGASTRLLLPGGNSRRALSWGIAAAARKHSKWICARWRRGELFSSNNGGASGAWEGGGGDWKETGGLSPNESSSILDCSILLPFSRCFVSLS